MRTNPWGKFFWSDYASDHALRICSLAAQGLWMRMLCIAAAHDPIGYVAINGRGLGVTDIARMAGVPETEASELIAELDRNGVFSRDRHQRIYSRRMVRDAKRAALARKNGKNGGNPSLGKRKANPPPDNPPDNGGDNTHMPEARSQRLDKSLATLDDAGASGVDERAEMRRAAADRGRPSPAPADPRTAEVSLRVRQLCNFVAPPPDAHLVGGWLSDGFDPEGFIYPTVEAVVAQLGRKNDRVRTFKLLDLRLREAHAQADNSEDAEIARLQAIAARYPGKNPAWEARQKAAAGGGK